MKQILLTLLLVPTFIFSQGKLEKAKKNLSTQKVSVIKKGKPTVVSRRSTRNNSNSNNSNSFSDASFVEALVKIGFYGTVGIVFGRAQERDLNPYPYFDENSSGYIKDLVSNSPQKNSFKIGGNYLLTGEVKGFELNGVYKILPILGIEASHLHFFEKTRNGSNFLDISSLLLNYYRIREKYVNLWWSAGVSYVGNEVNKLGFSYKVGTEIYPIKPISLNFSWQQSFINREEVNTFKSNIKCHLKNKAFYTGYHNFNLAREKISGIVIGFEYQF